MSDKVRLLIEDNPELEKLFERVIPKGDYCYTHNYIEKKSDGMFIRHINLCPFWEKNLDVGDQESGYCHLLDQGDWQEDGTFLLWDQVKECGLNKDDRSFEDNNNEKS